MRLQDGRTVRLYAGYEELLELEKHIDKALVRKIPAVKFEDPDEKFLFKEQVLSHDGAFCSEEFRETIFGGVNMNARFCVTNKRLLLYHIDQITASGSGGDINYSLSAPVLKCIWVPLSGIASIARERRGLIHITRLYIKKRAPAGFMNRSAVIPKIDSEDGGIRYDPHIDNIRGRAAVDFSKLSRLNENDRSKVIGILKGSLPHQLFKGIK